MKLRDPTIPKLRHHLLADRAGPQYQRFPFVQFSKNAFCQFHSGSSHRHWPRAKLRFRAHALPDFQSALEEAIQHGPRRAALVREAIRFPHLAQNLRFAEQHGIEPRRNSKEMLHGFAIVVVIERHAEDIRAHRMELAQKSRKSGGTPYTSLRLQVESTSVSSRIPRARSSSDARWACSAVKDTFSRTSTGAVR